MDIGCFWTDVYILAVSKSLHRVLILMQVSCQNNSRQNLDGKDPDPFHKILIFLRLSIKL